MIPKGDIETLKAAHAVMVRHGFDGEDLEDTIAAAEQANVDEERAGEPLPVPVLDPVPSTAIARNKATGHEIRGTLETVRGVAEIERFSRDEAGKLVFLYSGETVIWWDEQRTVERAGNSVFIDTDGNELVASDIVFEAE